MRLIMRSAELSVKNLVHVSTMISLGTTPVLCIYSSILPVYTHSLEVPFPEPEGNAHMCINIWYLLFSFWFTLYDRLSVHPHLYKWPNFFPFYGCVIFHCMYVLHLLYPFICSWIFRLLPYPGYYGWHGTPLQYSCLEDPMDGEVWWAAVHGVTKSRTRRSDLAGAGAWVTCVHYHV